MKITIRVYPNRTTASPQELASEYKVQGLDKYVAWDQFIKDRNLKPEIDAKEFYKIYSGVEPAALLKLKEIDFFPNLIDLVCNQRVEAHCDECGVWSMTWEDGTVGSFPPCDPPDPEKFVRYIN